MQRVKLFEAAHKGLRNALSQFSLMLGKADFSNKEEVIRLHRLGKDMFMMLTSHANDENTIILSELEKKVPGSSKHDMDDHEWLEKEQEAIEKMLEEAMEISDKGEDPAGICSEMYLKFEKFHGDYLIHTYEEETATQNLLWDNFTDAEIHAMRGKIISRFTPEAFEKWQSFILPSITHKDRFMMFSGIKANAPGQFTKLMVMAEKYLPEEEFNKLKNSLE